MVTLPLSMERSLSVPGDIILQDEASNQQQKMVKMQGTGQVTLQGSAKQGEVLSSRKDEGQGGNKSPESTESDSGGPIMTAMQPPSISFQAGNELPPSFQTFAVPGALPGQATFIPGNGAGNMFWIPGNHVMGHGDSSMYQIPVPAQPANLPPNNALVMNAGIMQSPHQLAEEASRKREMRLIKNNEAAKACRRRKKEYEKCLETRVAVLEHQNKQLIDELKRLREMYEPRYE